MNGKASGTIDRYGLHDIRQEKFICIFHIIHWKRLLKLCDEFRCSHKLMVSCIQTQLVVFFVDRSHAHGLIFVPIYVNRVPHSVHPLMLSVLHYIFFPVLGKFGSNCVLYLIQFSIYGCERLDTMNKDITYHRRKNTENGPWFSILPILWVLLTLHLRHHEIARNHFGGFNDAQLR